VSRESNNGKGIVFQRPGAFRNSDSIRIMEPDADHPNGYVRIYSSHNQPVDFSLKPSGDDLTYIPEDEEARSRTFRSSHDRSDPH
jgi:hypothetical protein